MNGWQLANRTSRNYIAVMIIIRFPDDQAKKRALGYLPGRFSLRVGPPAK